MANSKSLNQRQREADSLHHQLRIKWLESDAPTWACGTPVSKSDRHKLLRDSKEAMTLIENGITLNHANRGQAHVNH